MSISIQLNSRRTYYHREERFVVIGTILIAPLQERMWLSRENSALKFPLKMERADKNLFLSFPVRMLFFFLSFWSAGLWVKVFLVCKMLIFAIFLMLSWLTA